MERREPKVNCQQEVFGRGHIVGRVETVEYNLNVISCFILNQQCFYVREAREGRDK